MQTWDMLYCACAYHGPNTLVIVSTSETRKQTAAAEAVRKSSTKFRAPHVVTSWLGLSKQELRELDSDRSLKIRANLERGVRKPTLERASQNACHCISPKISASAV